MPTVSTEFTAPCTQDKAILAVQDLANSLQWPILELAATRIVLNGPRINQLQAVAPKVTIELQEITDETRFSVTVSLISFQITPKKQLIGIMGQVVNGISVRVQTKSIAINPTVALGEGQGDAQSESPKPGTDRIGQLERLQKLLESGILTRDEFDAEKQKILREN